MKSPMQCQTIEEARKSLSITQDDMADQLGITRPTYAKMERNPEIITIRDARLICSILGKGFGEILFSKLVNDNSPNKEN